MFLSPFQNGRPFPVKTLNVEGRLNVKTGPEGFIPKFTTGSKSEKVCKVFMEGNFLQVHVPVFWTNPSITGVYKTNVSFHLTYEKNQHQNDNTFERYLYSDSNNTRSSLELRHSHISSVEFGFYNQCKEYGFLGMEKD